MSKENKDYLINEFINDPLYKINRDGSIQTKLTLNGQGVSDKWRDMGYQKADGYVRLRYKDDFLFVHRIIYRKFKGPIKEGYTIDHKDLDRSNNAVDNLIAVTQADNNKNKSKTYNKSQIVKKVMAKLSSLKMNDSEFNIAKKEFDKLNSSQMKSIGKLRREYHMFGTLEELVRDFKINLSVKDYGVYVSIRPTNEWKWISYKITNSGKLINKTEEE
jgi:hypothetical protein